MSASDEYHGIVVEESLQDKGALKGLRILGRRKGRDWTLLRVGVERVALKPVVERIRRNLRVESGVPFYAHFYRPGELIVIFPDREFHLSPDRKTWDPAITYGKSVGIPPEQLDFAPCCFEDETY